MNSSYINRFQREADTLKDGPNSYPRESYGYWETNSTTEHKPEKIGKGLKIMVGFTVCLLVFLIICGIVFVVEHTIK